MTELRHSYCSVAVEKGASYGGNQGWFLERWMRESGCGVIASADLMVYLHRHHSRLKQPRFSVVPMEGEIPLGTYLRIGTFLRKGYFPLIPKIGLSAPLLVVGLNRLFHANNVPLRAGWCVLGTKLWSQMEQQLQADYPVILAIGANIPFIWQKHKLALYRKDARGEYRVHTSVKAHYITVTGMDDTWLRVSSWGQEYYIRRKEYTAYVKKHSSFLVSNMVVLTPKKSKVGV